MNSHGVSVTLNAIRSTSLDRTLLPLHLFLRTLLQQPSLASCLALISTLPGLASTCHILIADPTCAVGVECAPQGFALLHPDAGGRVCHTNHFVDENLKVESGAVNLWEDSPERLEVVQKRIGEMDGKVSQQRLRDVLADRSIGTKGICRHDSEDGKGVSASSCDECRKLIRPLAVRHALLHHDELLGATRRSQVWEAGRGRRGHRALFLR